MMRMPMLTNNTHDQLVAQKPGGMGHTNTETD